MATGSISMSSLGFEVGCAVCCLSTWRPTVFVMVSGGCVGAEFLRASMRTSSALAGW